MHVPLSGRREKQKRTRHMKSRWEKLLSYKRYNGSSLVEEEFDSVRNPFVIDQDRITFSSSFRRLSKKKRKSIRLVETITSTTD